MRSTLKAIYIFNHETREKRELTFNPGLNIISGDSKTGKSAIIEIVDYCLFSKRSTIPKGKITDFADFFCLVLKVEGKYLVVCRPSEKTKKSEKAFFSIETSDSFLIDFSFDYFNKRTLKDIKTSVQPDFESHLGLSVLDNRSVNENDIAKTNKVSIRNAAPLLFQHQNLIANKHTLFYRFDDYHKRKRTIEEFPVFMGWVDGHYFSTIREAELLRKEIKLEIDMMNLKLKKEVLLEKEIYSLISEYYSSIGLVLEEGMELKRLKEIGKQLPIMPITNYSNAKVATDIARFSDERELLMHELSGKEHLIYELSAVTKNSIHFISKVSILKEDDESEMLLKEISCPLCSTLLPHKVDKVLEVIKSKQRLRIDLGKTGQYQMDCSIQLEELRIQRDNLKRKINTISYRINSLQMSNSELKKGLLLRDLVMIQKGKIENRVDQLVNSSDMVKKGSPLASLKKELKIKEEFLEKYDLKGKRERANNFLAQRMNEICQKLDFEDELRAGNLTFDLETFHFYLLKDGKHISLSEMGSGANWLACHLSLFIALLHLTCKAAKASVPNFLFIDQPSQVYFPRTYLSEDLSSISPKDEDDFDENIKQVKNIFKVMKDELIKIEKECNFLPQIIVMDHADEKEFALSVIQRWRRNGKKLI